MLSLVMAQLSLAIAILCLSWERRRSEEQCQPWAVLKQSSGPSSLHKGTVGKAEMPKERLVLSYL